MNRRGGWICWLYLAVLTVLLIVPVGPVLHGAGVGPSRASLLMTAGHAVGYLLAGALAVAVSWSVRLALTVATLHGPAMEVVQAFVPWRNGEVSDVLVDLLGVAAGAVLASWYIRWRQASATFTVLKPTGCSVHPQRDGGHSDCSTARPQAGLRH